MQRIYCLISCALVAISTAQDCDYKCQSNGGCTVSYGLTSGSCFSAKFGGSCSGTPSQCSDCNRVLNCGGGSSGGGSSGGRPSGGRPSGGMLCEWYKDILVIIPIR